MLKALAALLSRSDPPATPAPPEPAPAPPPRFIERSDFIAGTIDKGMFGLEIGPSFNPAFLKAEGWNVGTVDHASADVLRAKYDDRDTSRIEEVDYISDGRALSELIPRRKAYDFIFASHVVEHLVDLIGFFKSCDELLKPDGTLVLVVPDKRQCFDFLQTNTSTGDLLDAHISPASRHSAGRTFDYMAYTADLGGNGVWESHWAEQLRLEPHFAHSVAEAMTGFEQARSSAKYRDIHAWHFVPSSFRLIMRDLHEAGVIALKEASFFPTNRCEFYFTASFSAPGCPRTRLELVRDIAREQIEGLHQVTAVSA